MIYQDLEILDYAVRTFSADLDSTELVWHRDDEDRVVVSLEKTDWRIQLENKLPQDLNVPVFINRGEWHRLIKGTRELKIKIVKS
jgi:hypothetical protein